MFSSIKTIFRGLFCHHELDFRKISIVVTTTVASRTNKMEPAMTAGSNLSVKNELIVEKIANVNPCAFNGPTAGKLRLQAKIVDN